MKADYSKFDHVDRPEEKSIILCKGPLESEEYYANAYKFQFAGSEEWDGVFLVFRNYEEGDVKLVKELLARLGFSAESGE